MEKIFSIQRGYSPAYILIIIILSIFVTFLLYGIFHPYVVDVFPSMMVDNGGDQDFAMFSIEWWTVYLPVAFVVSMIIFVIVNSQRRGEV